MLIVFLERYLQMEVMEVRFASEDRIKLVQVQDGFEIESSLIKSGNMLGLLSCNF